METVHLEEGNLGRCKEEEESVRIIWCRGRGEGCDVVFYRNDKGL